MAECCKNGCKGCQNCCKQCCDGCDKCCDNVCACLRNSCAPIVTFFDRPMSMCLVFAILIGGGMGVLGLAFGGVGAGEDCGDAAVGVWLLVQGVVFLFHLGIAIYLFRVFAAPYNEQGEDKDKDYFNRAEYVLMNSPVMACYIILALFGLAWTIVGHVWVAKASSSCPKDVISVANVCLIFSWIWYALGVFGFLFTLCMQSCCRACPCCASLFCCCEVPDDGKPKRGRTHP